jgi:hypothetical protein
VLAGFLLASVWGPRAAGAAVLGFVVLITWYSALDYLALGFRELARAGERRALHWARLAAGAAMPIVALAAIATDGLPTIPIILLLSSDMARGALDNYAAHRGIADFSWATSLWAEIALLVVAIASPVAGGVLTVIAALIAITEMLRSFGRYLRAPAAESAPVVRPAPARAPAER